jgi:hypothetical protein
MPFCVRLDGLSRVIRCGRSVRDDTPLAVDLYERRSSLCLLRAREMLAKASSQAVVGASTAPSARRLEGRRLVQLAGVRPGCPVSESRVAPASSNCWACRSRPAGIAEDRWLVSFISVVRIIQDRGLVAVKQSWVLAK